MYQERLQKILAKAGVASRRKAELLILEGAVSVNGRITVELGTKVDPVKDKIKVNGKLIYTEVESLYVALYKPKGMISALSDPQNRQHLGLLLKHLPARVTPIGRLDYNSEGLLLLTNDGALFEKIFKTPSIPKTYLVKIKGHPTLEDLEFLKKGFFTKEGVLRFQSYHIDQKLKNKTWLKLKVIEGSKLNLRELLNHKGLLVDRIIRTMIGNISLNTLKPGEYRLLKREAFVQLV